MKRIKKRQPTARGQRCGCDRKAKLVISPMGDFPE
jgi:hypothetical protein